MSDSMQRAALAKAFVEEMKSRGVERIDDEAVRYHLALLLRPEGHPTIRAVDSVSVEDPHPALLDSRPASNQCPYVLFTPNGRHFHFCTREPGHFDDHQNSTDKWTDAEPRSAKWTPLGLEYDLTPNERRFAERMAPTRAAAQRSSEVLPMCESCETRPASKWCNGCIVEDHQACAAFDRGAQDETVEARPNEAYLGACAECGSETTTHHYCAKHGHEIDLMLDAKETRSETALPSVDVHGAVQALVRAMWLYQGYRVDSRGPVGCLIEAIEKLEPETARKIRDGEAGDDWDKVYEREDDGATRTGSTE